MVHQLMAWTSLINPMVKKIKIIQNKYYKFNNKLKLKSQKVF